MPLFGKKSSDKNEKNDKREENEKVTGSAASSASAAMEEGAKESKDSKESSGEHFIPTEGESGAAGAGDSGDSGEASVGQGSQAGQGGEIQLKRPKYVTPEGFEFNRYFLAERRIMLENVSYETTRPAQGQGQFKLGVKDTIVAQVIPQAGVKVTYNRTLRFDPEGPFVLSVSFAVMLVFNPGTKNEIDWRTIDVADEFKKNCPMLVQQMSAKAALLVAEITNVNGGMPIIPSR